MTKKDYVAQLNLDIVNKIIINLINVKKFHSYILKNKKNPKIENNSTILKKEKMKKKIVEKFNLQIFLSLLQFQLPSAGLSRSNNSVSLKSNQQGRELISVEGKILMFPNRIWDSQQAET